MEAIGFILQQFYYYFASGFVINLFIMANVLVWAWYTQKLGYAFGLLSKSNSTFIFIFIVSAVIISIIIVGFNELIFQYNKKIGDKSIVRKFFIEHWLLKGTHWRSATIRFTENERIMVSFTKRFFDDIGKYDLVKDKDDGQPYHNVFVGAKIIEHKEKNYDLYRFRDLSYLCQYMSTSVLFVFLYSITALLYLWLSGKCGTFVIPFRFYFASASISLVLFLLLPEIAGRFADRFIRVVGKTYTKHKIKDELLPENNRNTKVDG